MAYKQTLMHLTRVVTTSLHLTRSNYLSILDKCCNYLSTLGTSSSYLMEHLTKAVATTIHLTKVGTTLINLRKCNKHDTLDKLPQYPWQKLHVSLPYNQEKCNCLNTLWNIIALYRYCSNKLQGCAKFLRDIELSEQNCSELFMLKK